MSTLFVEFGSCRLEPGQGAANQKSKRQHSSARVPEFCSLIPGKFKITLLPSSTSHTSNILIYLGTVLALDLKTYLRENRHQVASTQ